MPSNDNDRWKRLAALGAKSEIPTPEGEARMSAVLLELAEPLLKQHGKSVKKAKAIIALTVAGWNQSMLPADRQSSIEQDLIDFFVPKDGRAEDIGMVVEIMEIVEERRERLFPDLRKVIVDYELEISGPNLTLNVSSAPVPNLG